MTARVLIRGAAAAAVLALGLVTAPAQPTRVSLSGTPRPRMTHCLGAPRCGPATGTTPDLASIDVQVDGKPVDATAESVKAGQVTRTTVLTLDASDSMSGARITAAKAAAKAFLDSAPPDVRIGLLTFSDKVHDVIAPTTDRESVAAAIDDIKLTHGTHMYDAVVQAMNLAGEEGARSVLLLSDGRDTGSDSSLQQAASASKVHGTSVDVVALDQSSRDRALVAKLSSASDGHLIDAADPDALRSVFTAEADSLAHQLLVRFPRPAGAADDVELAVSLAPAARPTTTRRSCPSARSTLVAPPSWSRDMHSWGRGPCSPAQPRWGSGSRRSWLSSSSDRVGSRIPRSGSAPISARPLRVPDRQA